LRRVAVVQHHQHAPDSRSLDADGPIPNQSSIAKAFQEFGADGRMKPSSYYDRIVDVMEELVRFTVLLRPHARQLVDRYSERKERDEPVDTYVKSAELAKD
jgi:arsenic resistance protein ArsH